MSSARTASRYRAVRLPNLWPGSVGYGPGALAQEPNLIGREGEPGRLLNFVLDVIRDAIAAVEKSAVAAMA